MNKMTTIACLVATALMAGCSTTPTEHHQVKSHHGWHSQNLSKYMKMYEKENAKGNDEQALYYLELAAKNNDPMAWDRLGESYIHQRYGLNNIEKGFEYTQKAAMSGQARAMTNLGILYLYGTGVKKDPQSAHQWFIKAAQKGDMKAPRYLGLIYQNGWGTAVDAQKAAQYYQQGATQGDITSQYYLGKLYETGHGVKQDYAKALDWYQKSAKRGDLPCLPAILALGHVYENGLGVEKDTQQALVWYKKAAALGDAGAKEKIAQYQYPKHLEIMNVTALVKVLGDGQKVAGVAIEYTHNVDPASLDLSDFTVPGREVNEIYLSHSAELGKPSATGSFVIVQLKTVIDPDSSKMGGGPKKGQGHHQGKAPVGHGGPQLGERSNKSPIPVTLKASVIQSGEVTLDNGVKTATSQDKLTSNQTLNPDIQGFKQFVFHDEKLNRDLMYNLYIPKNYDPNQSYPLVLFMHDAGAVSNNPIETLTQGSGAVVWASARDQAKHPSFVLAPQYNAVMTGDNSVTTADMDVTVDLVKHLLSEYSIDANRLYNTGQSMGGMASIAMNIKYPDLFAASYLVACQWGPKMVVPMANKPLWIVVSEGDTKAKPGMDAITAELKKHGATVANATWNAQAPTATLDKQAIDMMNKGTSIKYAVFKGGNHRYTWQYAYSIDAIRDWLFTQQK
ncbi:hypothetical protein F9817_13960 [Vibrio sp. CAIM 722]|uniref:Esterase Ig-like N-terminal domain-containing protein n=1 Tax=Vibrio eleionomae TaxID=2653505 RepID=A0A7X4RVH1_9VIBR|nr:alpha/beta hydrolase-fold protein [Vibrio eleionomae]MZI94297.1 hypothetical protein [Vibrio eleionomae]